MHFWQTLKKPIMVLAPMADVTDPAFRYIIAKYSKWGGQDIGTYGKFTRPHSQIVGGPDVMWTEFVSADGLFLGGYEHLIKDLAFTNAERPIVAQFFTSKPEMMRKAAELACDLGFDGIDINMGCPDKSVEKQGSGAAHIKNYKHAQEIILAAMEGWEQGISKREGATGVKATSASGRPVSVKTRIGYNKNEIEIWIPALLETKLAVITLHARTRKEMSSVPAEWGHIKRAVEIRNEWRDAEGNKSETLIFGNGDGKDLADAHEKVKETECDGVMLGRAIFGTPWLFSNSRELENRESFEVRKKILEILVEHTKLFEELLPHKSSAIMKKHYKAYVTGWDGAQELRMKLMEAKNTGEVSSIVNEYLKNVVK